MRFLVSFALEHEIVTFAWIDNASVQFPLNIFATKGYSNFRLLSIILLDVTIRFIKQLLVCVQLVFEQTPAQFLLDEAFPLGGSLPAIEADLFHNVVNVRDDALNDQVDRSSSRRVRCSGPR